MKTPDWQSLWLIAPDLAPEGVNVCRGSLYHEDSDNLRESAVAALCRDAAVRFLYEHTEWRIKRYKNDPKPWVMVENDYDQCCDQVREVGEHETLDGLLHAACKVAIRLGFGKSAESFGRG